MSRSLLIPHCFDRPFPHDNHVKQGIVGAQTRGQFHLIYGTEGTQALFTGLATQIIYGGCDHDTADFYSKASGTTTADANPDPHKANFRQRPLLTVDEVVTPQIGNCTIFARYVEPAFATQVILTARLTRLQWLSVRLIHYYPSYVARLRRYAAILGSSIANRSIILTTAVSSKH